MQVQVTTLTVRKNGSLSKRPATVSAEVLRFGRGTDNEVLLSDVRVGLAEAELHANEAGLFINQVGPNPLRINGAVTGASAVKVGDAIRIGPYEIIVVEPPPGFDVALTLEMKEPLGDDLARLQAHSRIGLDRSGLGKRGMSWFAFAVIALLFFALPVGAFFLDRHPDPRPNLRQDTAAPAKQRALPKAVNLSWNAGELSDPHKSFADNCQACHDKPFVMVRDEACLTCHSGIQHHADPKVVQVAALDQTRCGSCHQEHNGPHGAIVRAESQCTDCHSNIKSVAPNTELSNVGPFGAGHPQFKVSVVADAAAKKIVRVSLDSDLRPVDKPNLKFPHKDHLLPTGWPKTMEKLTCASCHVPDSGGIGMMPISFEKHCASCHGETLKFDAAHPDVKVPHGDPAAAARTVADHYARVALEGTGANEPDAPEVVRRRPGRPLTEPERLEALAWAKAKAAEMTRFVFDDKRGCGTCHTVENDGTAWRTQPVLLQASFMPKADFTHAKHTTTPCGDCHAAETSVSSSDLLLPKIESCQNCHGSENASAKVPSTCISCHDFHRHDLGPMRPRTALPITAQNKQ